MKLMRMLPNGQIQGVTLSGRVRRALRTSQRVSDRGQRRRWPFGNILIISGGQTGVDQAALDAAIKVGLNYGGVLPKGRLTENGPLPPSYDKCVEAPFSDYAKRTEMNVLIADVTLVINSGPLEGGTLFTVKLLKKHLKPYEVIDLLELSLEEQVNRAVQFINKHRPQVLNVAGPRASKKPGIYDEAFKLLIVILAKAGIHSEK